MAGREVRDVKAEWAAGAERNRLAVDFVDQQARSADRLQRNAGMEVVGGGMQGEIRRVGSRLGQSQQARQLDGLSLSLGIQLADVGHLPGGVDGRQVRKGQFKSVGYFAV